MYIHDDFIFVKLKLTDVKVLDCFLTNLLRLQCHGCWPW